jgi:hypothetical protein
MSARRLLAALALLVAGCVTPPPEPEAPEVSPQPAETVKEAPEPDARAAVIAPQPGETPRRVRNDEVERLLAYFENVRKLPPADLAREGESARAAFNRTRSDFDRARLALLLSIPNTALNDDQRAFDMLDPLVKNPSSNLHALAILVSAHVQERRRLESSMQNLQHNVQGLQQKLDALMSLERSLIDREQPIPPRKR